MKFLRALSLLSLFFTFSVSVFAQPRKIVFFQNTEATLSGETVRSLDHLCRYANDGTRVVIEAWSALPADATEEELNQLSETRAQAIRAHLLERGMLEDEIKLYAVPTNSPFRVTGEPSSTAVDWVVEVVVHPTHFEAPIETEELLATTDPTPEPGHESFEELLTPPHIAVIDPRKKNVINCPQGTILRLPVLDWQDLRTGELVKGRITLQIEEFYDNRDLLLAGLSMSSMGQVIESGGTLRISATAKTEGGEIAVEPTSHYTIEFPIKKGEKADDMQWFSGLELSGDPGIVNWNLNNTFVSEGWGGCFGGGVEIDKRGMNKAERA